MNKFVLTSVTVLMVLVLLPACAPPRATATPALAPSASTQPPAGRTVTPALRETPAGRTPTEEAAAAFPTARPHLYDEVDEAAILSAVFPNLNLTSAGDRYSVQGNQDWQVWVNDRDEGFVTQSQHSELIVVIGSVVGAHPPQEETPYGPSSSMIAVLEKQNGKLAVTHRQTLAPTASPEDTDVRLERTVDIDHNGTDEILVTFTATQSAVARIEAHLFQWQGSQLSEVWKGVEQEDNTAAPKQDQYYSYQAVVDFQDLDNDGKEEILVSGERILYNKDADGNPDFASAQTILADRQVFHWNGKSFEIDKAMTTPPAPQPTP